MPHTPILAMTSLPSLRSGQVSLDEAEHFLHNRDASVATLRWCSGSSRNVVRLPSGICVQLRRNLQSGSRPRADYPAQPRAGLRPTVETPSHAVPPRCAHWNGRSSLRIAHHWAGAIIFVRYEQTGIATLSHVESEKMIIPPALDRNPTIDVVQAGHSVRKIDV